MVPAGLVHDCSHAEAMLVLDSVHPLPRHGVEEHVVRAGVLEVLDLHSFWRVSFTHRLSAMHPPAMLIRER